MKKFLTSSVFTFLALSLFAQTPLSMNGRLKLVGKQLSNECGSPVQLRGMSTHGIMFHQECYTQAMVQNLATTWKADVMRLAVYTRNQGGTSGYIDGDRTAQKNWIDQMVQYTKAAGIYCIIDWHILEDPNPNTYKTEAKAFFTEMSAKYKNERHVIYEICNEPNGGTSWNDIKSYSNEIIPAIRANDPNVIILVGTPEWSSDLWAAANSPLTGANATNVMYTFHFYANSHYDYDKLRQTASQIPIFVSEWGSVDASGNGGFNSGSSDKWISVMDGDNNGKVKISSCNWAYVDKDEAASVLKPGSCAAASWNNRTTAGNYIFNYLTKADNFVQCNAAADTDGDGVANGSDLCANTPNGTFVGADGCPALQGDSDNDGVIDANDQCPNTPAADKANVNKYGCVLAQGFVSNVCEGFNNYNGYAYTTFTTDSVANVEIWNRPIDKNPVYSAVVSGGALNIAVTKGDPNFITQGISFGEVYRFNGTDYDTTLLPLDLRGGNKTVKMDMTFTKGNSYTLSDVMFDIQLEDADGKTLTSDAAGVLFRKSISFNTTTTHTFNFTGGQKESWDAAVCQAHGKTLPSGKPCLFTDFDWSKVSKVLMWVNPGAGASWAKTQAFTGTWKIDNFSIGYSGTAPSGCTTIRDDDKDGVKNEKDKCIATAPGATVNSTGCSASQLDDDKDGVFNIDDLCPATPVAAKVDYKGCSAAQADDDNDGVKNTTDLCPNTPAGQTVNATGCAQSELDDDKDGVPNPTDACANTPSGQTVNATGCAQSQLDDDKDGVKNNVDVCANTPSGQTVNSTGCAQSQLDDDNDGVKNNVDVCANTPSGQTVNSTGCAQLQLDDDNDGVKNNVDVCANTPSGQTVNSTGCAQSQLDDDNDGVKNNVDACANTPSGQTVNSTGCAQSQLDDDKDGVKNNLDLCANTPAGQTVNNSGCAQSQLDDDKDGVKNSVDQCLGTPAGQAVDAKGCSILTFVNDDLATKVSLYPMPVSELLSVEQTNFIYNKMVVTTVSGVKVLDVTLTSDFQKVSLEGLAPGVYMVALSGDNSSETLKIEKK